MTLSTLRPLSAVASGVLLVAGLAGCASSGASGTAGSTGTAVTDVPAPAKQPFQPPAFESTEFVDSDHGFRIHYPADWSPQESQDPAAVLSAASPMMAPRIDVAVGAASDGSGTLEDASADIERQLAETGGGEAEVLSWDETTLQDEVTPGYEFVVDWSFQGFPLSSVVLVAASPSGEHEVSVTVTGLQGGDLDELREIAYTLYFE